MIGSIAEAQSMLEKNHITFMFEVGISGKYLHCCDLDFTALYFVEPK